LYEVSRRGEQKLIPDFEFVEVEIGENCPMVVG
jgi:hypothetical protein